MEASGTPENTDQNQAQANPQNIVSGGVQGTAFSNADFEQLNAQNQ